jgi:putative heme-binding domain-containing protein
MRRAFVCVVLLSIALLVGTSAGQKKKPPYPPSPHIAATDPKTPEEERKCLRVPEGFEVQLVAAEPDIRKPININFDARGRLWVTGSVEYPFEAKDPARARDRLTILSDFAPDGRARKVSTFADHLNIPIGVLPVKDGAIVYSIPNIYRLRDTRGTGKSDKRDVLLGIYGHRDTHGMTGEFTWGFDGWVYACHGYANDSTVKAADGSQIFMNSGNTYRFRPDGSHVEYFTHGQVNPFGLTWDPLGNLYSCDCHSRPVYQLLRGAYYPSFQKGHDGIGFGPEMMTHDHGSTAIAGITYYAADQFPKEFQGNVFVGNVVTNRINRDRLEPHGSSYKGIEMPDFVKSDDPWFRPVDIKLGPDGALYVADFYNRIIGHYEVDLHHPGRDRERGRIWRIVYRGKGGNAEPKAPRSDWTRANSENLIEDLAHPNLTVRMIATNQLVERGKLAVPRARRALRFSKSAFQRLHSLWVLERLGALEEKELARAAGDPDRAVRVHAMRVLTDRKALPKALRDLALAGLKDKDAFVQRCAAEALGSHPAAENVRPLLDLRHHAPAADTHLLHAVRMTLRDQLRPAANWKKGQLASDWSAKDMRAVADVCPGTPTAEAAAFLFRYLQSGGLKQGGNIYRYVHHIARYGTAEDRKGLIQFARKHREDRLLHQRDLFRAVQQGTQERGQRLSEEARKWGTTLARRLLDSDKSAEVLAGIELAGALQMKEVLRHLEEMLASAKEPADRRMAAMTAVIAIDARDAVAPLAKVLGGANEPGQVREHAAGLLGQINRPEARAALVETLPTAPARLQNVIAVHLARTREGADKLLETVAAGKASARVLQEDFVRRLLEGTGLPKLKERLAKLTAGLPSADQKIQDLLRKRRNGFRKARADAGRGAKVFEKHCAVCHVIANKGAKIGPQLDGIGIRGLDRLLEDTLDPNRNVDQAFRLTTLTLKSGKIESGLLLRTEGEVYVLADAKGKEVRVPRSKVADKAVSQMSPMPANFADEIPEKEFYDLLAYLLAQRAK